MIALESTGSGEALALIHGLGTNRSIWRHAAPGLAPARRLLMVDMPGFGESPSIGSNFELAAVADAIATELATSIDGPYDLLGSSLGGAVALTLASRHPSAVRRLILLAPAGFSPRPAAVAAVARRLGGPVMAARRLLGTPVAGSAAARQVLFRGAIGDPGALPAAEARAMLQASAGVENMGAAVATAVAADLHTELTGLKPPLGLIWGERDGIVPTAVLSRIQRLAPAAEVETIPGAGHIPQLERPAEFAAAVERLLARL